MTLYRKGDKVRLVGREWFDRGTVVTVTEDSRYLDRARFKTPSTPFGYTWHIKAPGWEVEPVTDRLADWEIKLLGQSQDAGTIFEAVSIQHGILPLYDYDREGKR